MRIEIIRDLSYRRSMHQINEPEPWIKGRLLSKMYLGSDMILNSC